MLQSIFNDIVYVANANIKNSNNFPRYYNLRHYGLNQNDSRELNH